MKKVLSLFLVITVLMVTVTTVLFTVNAVVLDVSQTVTALKTTTAISVDANLSEWVNVPKTSLGYYDFSGDKNGETMNAPDDSYFQVVYDANKIYVAAALTDTELHMTDKIPGRDWFKLVFDLDGVATTNSDSNTRALTVVSIGGDGWYPQVNGIIYNWEGYSQAQNGHAFKNGSMKLSWNNGITYVECSFDVNDNLKDRLVAGSKFGFGVKYEDYLINATDINPTNRRYLWGDDNYKFLDDISRFGTLELSSDEVSMVQPPAPTGTPTVIVKKVNVGSEVVVDAFLNEWSNVPKTNLGYFDYAGDKNGESFNVPDDSYFQVVYDANKIYVAATFTDAELQMTDKSPGRDWFKLIFDLDGLATVNSDSNARALTAVAIGGDGWFPQVDGTIPFNWEGYSQAQNGHALKNGIMKIQSTNGVTYVECSFDVNDNLRDRLVAGSKFGFGVKYEDYLINATDINPTNRRYLWGDDNYKFLDDISKNLAH